EQQNCETKLIATHRLKSGHREEAPVLHVALTPAQIATNEFEQGWRVFFPAELFVGQNAHGISGGAHQCRLNLIVAQYVAGFAPAARQYWKFTVRDKRSKPKRRVVTP